MAKVKLLLMTVLTSFCVLSASKAFALTLPDPSTTIFGSPVALQYGDFYSYALPVSAYYYDLLNGGGVGPGSPYYVRSEVGDIKDDIVIATGADGKPVYTNFTGMDDAYETPNGIKSTNPWFNMRETSVYPEPDPTFTGDNSGTWDSRLDALNLYLGGSDMIFLFNNNQINSGDAVNQNLYAWGQVALVDLQDATRTLYFDFTKARTGNNVLLYNSPGPADSNYPNSDYPDYFGSGTWPNFNDNFVLSGGQIAIDPVTHKVRLDSNGNPLPAQPGDIVLNLNLGANQAAYALFSPELNALVKNYTTNGYDVLQGDFRMTALNNGYEQLFLQHGTVLPPPVIPEPATLLLFGTGIIGLAGAFRRKK